MLPPTVRIPKIGEKLLCIDDTGLDLGLIKAGEIYEPVSWCIGKGKFKGFHLNEVAYTLKGIGKTMKSSRCSEGSCFSARRFVIVGN
jgi:hypothetical protein